MPASLQEDPKTTLQEVVDKNNRPLCVLPVDTVHKQSLRHRSVHVLVFNQEGKLYLQKRHQSKQSFPGRWDASARGHVLMGEATRDTAHRLLTTKLGMRPEKLQKISEFPACPETGQEFITVYAMYRTAQNPLPNKSHLDTGYFYSPDELTCMIREFRELLTPYLILLWESGLTTPPY